MSLLSSKDLKLLTNPLNLENPITVQILGVCSALAVTVQLEPAIVMAISVTVVTAFSNAIISLLRNTIPSRIRIIVQLVVIAALVIIVDQILKAFAYEVSKQLSVFVGLIITNCIIMGRLEAFALGNKPWPSFLDGLGNGAGYGVILILIAFVRELFGSGKIFGIEVFGHLSQVVGESTGLYAIGYVNNGFIILPPMALILLGIIIWIQRSRTKELMDA